jgi:Xaa-Pro aminopeptidase
MRHRDIINPRMPAPSLIAAHRRVQDAAKAVLSDLVSRLGPQDTEESIAAWAANAMRERGIGDTWYHDCPALVLLGSRSCESVSGRHYRPAAESVGEHNVVTVDLSPRVDDIWGDCARTYIVEEGRVVATPADTDHERAVSFLRQLHARMREFVRPATRFHELWEWSEQQICAAGFENLDFRGNVGHSLATRREDRRYIERGNHATPGGVHFFTYEPHVRARGGRWGYKHEDVFFFDELGNLQVL